MKTAGVRGRGRGGIEKTAQLAAATYKPRRFRQLPTLPTLGGAVDGHVPADNAPPGQCAQSRQAPTNAPWVTRCSLQPATEIPRTVYTQVCETTRWGTGKWSTKCAKRGTSRGHQGKVIITTTKHENLNSPPPRARHRQLLAPRPTACQISNRSHRRSGNLPVRRPQS